MFSEIPCRFFIQASLPPLSLHIPFWFVVHKLYSLNYSIYMLQPTSPAFATATKPRSGWKAMAMFPLLIILYFITAFSFGLLSSVFMSDEKTSIFVVCIELLLALTIVGFGHKLFMMAIPSHLNSPSANVIFAFVAMNANGKLGGHVKRLVSSLPSYR
jgi:hypothetical protein